MRRKLLVTIALGAALAIIAAGTATSKTVGGVQVDAPTDTVLPQCSNLSDDDGDGLVDLGDPGCSGPLDTSEYNAPTSGGDSGTGETGGSGSGGTGTGTGTGSTTSTTTTTGTTTTGTTTTGGTGKAGSKVDGTGGKGLFGKQDAKGKGTKAIVKGERKKIEQPALRNPDGSPADANPGLTIAQFGPAPIGVPNPVIDAFEIPPFLLPIYQSCGTEYGIPWQVLASINKIETGFGTNLSVSSAGAMGWMQFIPSTWEAYGVDANEDERKDPYNPVDAICAAARYLRAAGGAEDLRTAIFAYNHADWYVDEVLLYANQYGELPEALVGSLTGLTEGAHFPVAADARYADDIDERRALARSGDPRAAPGNAADVISENATRRSINIYSSVKAPVVAVNDGVIKAIGENARGSASSSSSRTSTATATPTRTSARSPPSTRCRASASSPPADFKITTRERTRPRPPRRAPGRTPPRRAAASKAAPEGSRPRRPDQHGGDPGTGSSPSPSARRTSIGPGLTGQLDALLGQRVPGYETFKAAFAETMKFDSKTMELRPLKLGSQVTGGSVIGRIGRSEGQAPTSTSRSSRPARAPRRSIRSRSSTAGSSWRRRRSIGRRARIRSGRTPRSARSC